MERFAPRKAVSSRLLVPPAALEKERYAARDDGHHYLSRVRRLKPGDEVILFDGEGCERSGVIDAISAEQTDIRLAGAIRADAQRQVRWISILPFIKGERMERCLCQLAELGIDEIRLFRAARAVVHLSPDKEATRCERYRRVLTSAASQSRRAMIPEVTGPFSFREALTVPAGTLRLFFYEGASDRVLGQALPPPAPRGVAFVTGPEGGFTDEEVEVAQELGYASVGLGPFLLRADTAPVAALSMLQYRYLHHDRVAPNAGA